MSPPRRVALIVRPAAGGMRRHVSLLAGGLAEQGCAPALYAPVGFTADPECGIPIVHVPIGAGTLPVRDLLVMRRLAGLLVGHTDIVHAHGLRAALIGAGAAARCRLPFLFTAHNLVQEHGRVERVVTRAIARRADRVIAVSHAVAASLTAIGVSPDKVTVIPNGIDMTPFGTPFDRQAVRTAYGIAPGSTLLVAAGRLSPEKGFDLLLEAVGLLTGIPGLQVLVAGAGPEERALARTIADRSLPVRLIGVVSNLASLLRAADIVAIPSRAEGQGIVAIEAMAAGAPIVATRVGGLPETVTESETGLLVPAEDPVALAAAIGRVIGSPALRAALGKNGVRRAAEYTVDVMCGRTMAQYAEAADPRDRELRAAHC